MSLSTGLLLVALAVLFIILGKAADIIIVHIRALAEKIGLSIFFLGILLGMLTSLPELAIGLNAITENIGGIALGNLMGGIVVLLCLVLGTSALLNRNIKTNGKTTRFLPILLYILLPIGLGFDGRIGIIDGAVLVILYFWLLYTFYLQRHPNTTKKSSTYKAQTVLKDGFYVVAALALVVVSSTGIVRVTERLLESYPVSPFLVGLLLYSLGTNLPELTVTFRSWKNNIRDLSLSNLIGSSISNIFLIGVFATMKPFAVSLTASHYAFGAFMVVMLTVVFIFYKTSNKITRIEGLALVCLYIAFLATQTLAIIGNEL